MWVAAALAMCQASRHVTLDAVGDVMLGRWVAKRMERLGANSALAGVRAEFGRADLVVGNLECALTNAPFALQKPILLRASPRFLPALTGFSALSLANNHASDCGEAGVKESQKLLESARIVPVGPGLSSEIIVRNGLRIGFLGMQDLPPSWLDTAGPWQDAVRRLRKQVDVEIVMVHWGIEGSSLECNEQKVLAIKLATLGVDLVLGCHPHVFQPIRWLPSTGGHRCLVAFSLGNFLFDARSGLERKSMILQVSLGVKGVNGYRTIPIRIEHGYPRIQFAPLVAERIG